MNDVRNGFTDQLWIYLAVFQLNYSRTKSQKSISSDAEVLVKENFLHWFVFRLLECMLNRAPDLATVWSDFESD